MDLRQFLQKNQKQCLDKLPLYRSHSIWETPKYKPFNNCYAYASRNLLPNLKGKLQPGQLSHRRPLQPDEYSCANFKRLIALDNPGTIFMKENKPCPCGYTKAFLTLDVKEPYRDFHFYREDYDPITKRFYWSHKPGSLNVKLTDGSGNPILDPRIANRNERPYEYDVDCGYMCFPPPKPDTYLALSRQRVAQQAQEVKHFKPIDRDMIYDDDQSTIHQDRKATIHRYDDDNLPLDMFLLASLLVKT